jgi:hypothetical protein
LRSTADVAALLLIMADVMQQVAKSFLVQSVAISHLNFSPFHLTNGLLWRFQDAFIHTTVW